MQGALSTLRYEPAGPTPALHHLTPLSGCGYGQESDHVIKDKRMTGTTSRRSLHRTVSPGVNGVLSRPVIITKSTEIENYFVISVISL